MMYIGADSEREVGKRQRRRIHALTGAALALGTMVSLSGCAGVAEFKATECHVSVNNPHESSGSPGFIDGKLTIRCSGTDAPQSVTGVVKLQRKAGKLWVDVSGTRRSESKAPVRLGKKYVVMTGNLRCSKGAYRTAGKGWGVLDGKKSKSRTWGHSQVIVDPCG